jgi:hypothetical protein
MLFQEERLHYYTFDLDHNAVKNYGTEDCSSSLLRWQVKSALFKYLDKKFITTDSDKYYNFKHDNIIILITNDENKIEEISHFLHTLLQDDKLVNIYLASRLNNHVDKDHEVFTTELNKFYDYYILEKELSNSNEIRKKVKL